MELAIVYTANPDFLIHSVSARATILSEPQTTRTNPLDTYKNYWGVIQLQIIKICTLVIVLKFVLQCTIRDSIEPADYKTEDTVSMIPNSMSYNWPNLIWYWIVIKGTKRNIKLQFLRQNFYLKHHLTHFESEIHQNYQYCISYGLSQSNWSELKLFITIKIIVNELK